MKYIGHITKADLKVLGTSLVLPPLGVYLKHGKGTNFWTSVGLSACGLVPGIVYSIYLVNKYPGMDFRHQSKKARGVWSSTSDNHVIYLIDANISGLTLDIPEIPDTIGKQLAHMSTCTPPTTVFRPSYNYDDDDDSTSMGRISDITLPELATTPPLSEIIRF
ncbi:hypothetical protein EV182_004512 [Spiromyces aspiralis]|uniref:Uncharacterized protein n=1 Tax=Spiromyces aspiralis TaxID=68401 RepID=A0ACC1HEK4_9FUNG|nr:hypothetical protein EV182_004512 [Spiromyces aspiralis]